MRFNVRIFLIAVRSLKQLEFLLHLAYGKAKGVRALYIAQLGCIFIEEKLLLLLWIKVWWIRIIALPNLFGIGDRGKLHVLIAHYLRGAWHRQVARLFAFAHYVWSAESHLLERELASSLEILLLEVNFYVKFLFLKSLLIALDSHDLIFGVFARLGLVWVVTQGLDDKILLKRGPSKEWGTHWLLFMLQTWGVVHGWAKMMAGRVWINVSWWYPFFEPLVLVLSVIIKVELFISERRDFRVWLQLAFVVVAVRLLGTVFTPLLHLL